MIANKQDSLAAARLEEHRRLSPVIAQLIDYADTMEAVLEVDTDSKFFEMRSPEQPRLRMRVILQESESIMVFLYKKSTLPYSRDRFTYGAVIFGARTFHGADFLECVEFLRANFHPEKRPAKLKRAFKYTIED